MNFFFFDLDRMVTSTKIITSNARPITTTQGITKMKEQVSIITLYLFFRKNYRNNNNNNGTGQIFNYIQSSYKTYT